MNLETMQFDCPDGLIACSTNTALGGSTVCMETIVECPVTDLQILPKDSQSTILDDPKYTSRLSRSDPDPLYQQLYLSFTSQSNDRSNSPLQVIKLETGNPCAFSDQQNVVLGSQVGPVYYPLEAATNKDQCQDFYPTISEQKTDTAVDQRYGILMEQTILPNEYELQMGSGVLATLQGLPFFK